MEKIEVFVQVEGDIRTEVVTVPVGATVDDIVRAAAQKSLPVPADGGLLFVEEEDTPVEGKLPLKMARIEHRSRVHIHRCKIIDIKVHFKSETKEHPFPPSATVGRVRKWALDEFIKHGTDQTDHQLQICDTDNRPNLDIQIGALTQSPGCKLCFDLVPVQRVEG